MYKHMVKAAIRNLWKKKFLTFAKILGLVVGFCVFLFLAEKIQYETSYDKFWNNSQSIYRVALDITYEDGEKMQSAKNFAGASELLDGEMDEVVAHCNFAKDVVTVFNGPTQKIQDVDFVWSDPTFFSVFERRIRSDNTASLLENIHGIAISESFSKKLFGKEDPLGKELTVNEGWKFVVDAVFEDIPSNSHMKIDMISTYKTLFYYMRNFDNEKQILVENPDFEYVKADPYGQNRWRTPVQYRPYSYIKLEKGASVASVASSIGTLLNKVALPENLGKADMDFIFQPVSEIHLKSKLHHEQTVNGEWTRVVFLFIIILVVLLICLINFISLNTISTMESAKSHSIRLLNGSRYAQVFQLLFVESVLCNCIGICAAIPIAYYLVGSQLPIDGISLVTYIIFGAIAIIAILLAAIVPFISVIKNKAFSIVKAGAQKLNQKWTNQKVLVTLQFSITIVLIICTLGIYKQMRFIMNKELGFNGKQTVFSYTPMTMNQHPELAAKLTTFKNEVSALGNVAAFSVSSSIPGKPIDRLSDEVRAMDSKEPFPATFNQISIDNEYLDTYNIQVLAGENLAPQSDWRSNEILINKTAISKMGLTSANEAIGKSIAIGNTKYQIRGVVQDYHHVSLHDPVTPTIYAQNLEWDHSVGYYSIQINSNAIAGVTKQIAQIWNSLYPKEEFIFNFSDAVFEAQYHRDEKFNQILSYSTLLAIFISSLGLLGVALFNTKKRIKEIGIRKVNGAKVNQILFTLNKDFVKWVGIAYIIACPVAWYALGEWLTNYAYKTTMGLWIYLLAGLVSVCIALLTVSWQSYRAAQTNPVESLRAE